VDVLACPECSGRMQLVASIAEAKAAKRILDHLALDSTGPPVARAQPNRSNHSRVLSLAERRVPEAVQATFSAGTVPPDAEQNVKTSRQTRSNVSFVNPESDRSRSYV